MREHGTYLVGTDFPASRTGQARFELILERNRRALAAGTPMAFGSDVVYSQEGSTRGELTLEFLESFTGADFPNDYILKMFTMNAADLLGVNTGQIKEGLAADIIAMDVNPLDDVAALRAVHFVMKDGRVYKQDGEFQWETPRSMNNPRRKPSRTTLDRD
jgi:imidazolonepropionase-like amidohydrolase